MALCGILCVALLGDHAAAQPAGPDPRKEALAVAPAGAYRLDSNHHSVIARIRHEGRSYSTFRFDTVSGSLNWNPAQVEASKVEIAIDAKSIATPVAGFATMLQGERFLNAGKFPKIEFVSTRVRPTGPDTGEIDGDLTFLGQTRPVTIRAELGGVGRNIRGVPSMGFQGSAKFKRSDFGLVTLPEVVGDEVELVIDIEFNRQG
jgi:polyisoprenoid-binding protein YceI